MAHYLINLLGEFEIFNKKNIHIALVCIFTVVLQLFGFIWKPFIVLELIFLILIISLTKPERSICYLFFMLPFYNVFRLGVENLQFNQILSNFFNIYFSIWLLLAFVINLLIRYIIDLIKHRKRINLKKVIIYLLVYVSFLLPLYHINSATISSFLVITALFSVIYLVFEYKNNFNLKLLIDCWLIGILSSLIVFLFKDVLPLMQGYLVYFPGRFNCLLRDPNYWALEVVCLLLAFTSLYFKGKIKYSYPYIFILLSVLALLSGSKAFFITFIVFLVSFLVCFIMRVIKRKEYKEWKLKFIIPIVIGVISLILLLLIVFKEKTTLLFERLFSFNNIGGSFEDKLNKLTTGRYGIWVKYISIVFSSWQMALFGRGVLNGYEFEAVHNTPIQILYYGGVLGIVLIVGIVILIIYRLSKINKINLFDYLGLFVMFILSCSLDLLLSYRLSFIIVIFGLMMLDNVCKHQDFIKKAHDIKKETATKFNKNFKIAEDFEFNDDQRKKVAILMPPFSLPADASKGGAIEQLMATLINKNEEHKRFNFIILSTEQIENNYANTYNIKVDCNKLLMKIKAGIFTILKKLKLLKTKRYNCLYYDTCFKILENINPDYIIFESKFPLNIKNYTKKFGKDKIMLHIHNHEQDKIDFSQYFSTIICVSDFIKNDIENNIKFKYPIQLMVLNNCLTSSNFNIKLTAEKKLNIRKDLGFTKDDFVIIYCGRLHPDKGPDILLKAAKQINTNIKLLIIGESFFKNSKKTRYVKTLEEISNGFRDRIKFTGYIKNNELYKYYQISDVQVIPTMCEEAAGMVALEGKVSGIPQIITQSGGLKEYACENCITVKRDINIVENIAKAINYVYEGNYKFIEDTKNIYDAMYYYDRFNEILNYKK